jgi:small nuclear ribonucleoprotein (snRNP)-like protein
MRNKTRQFAAILVLLSSFLLSSVTLAAQSGTSDWSRLSSVTNGSKLSVKLRNGKNIDGTLSGVSDTSLTLMVKNTATEVKRDDVLSVHEVVKKSAAKATLIGLGVGAGAGALVGVAADASSKDNGLEKIDSVATAATTVIGAGVGALAGYFIGRGGNKRVLLFEAK